MSKNYPTFCLLTYPPKDCLSIGVSLGNFGFSAVVIEVRAGFEPATTFVRVL